jgi:predicted nucleic acid-binding protein
VQKVIVDTSGLYAMVDRADPHHVRASAFLRSRSAPRELLVSNHVFDETMTLVKLRLGVHVAMQLGVRLRNSRLIKMVVFSQAQEQETWRIFSRYLDKEWSYTDCACLVLAQEHETTLAFSFDHHFDQMGLYLPT